MLVFVMVGMLGVTAFASGDAEPVEDVAEAVDVIEAPAEENADQAEAAPAEAPADPAPAKSSNSGATSTLLWGLGLIAVCGILIVVSNNKIKKGKKGAK